MEKFPGTGNQNKEEKKFAAERLEKVIDSAFQELGEVKKNVISGEYSADECIAVEHKIRTLFVELANEQLRPDKMAKPLPKSE